MWSRGRRFDVHVTTLAARRCLHARLPTPAPAVSGVPSASGRDRAVPNGHSRTTGGPIEGGDEVHRRRHRSHSSRQAFRHFGTRLTPVHRMNGPRTIGVRRPSYLCLAVPSGSQAFSFRFQALCRRLCRLRPRDCCEHREFETRYGSLRFFGLVHRRKTCALASRTVLLLEETNSSLSSSALSPFLLLPAYICP